MSVYSFKRLCNRTALAAVALLGCGATAPAVPDQPKDLQRTADPVVIAGARIGGLDGAPIDAIRVYAFHDGAAVPIPFQIDQRDAAGDWVWDVVYTRVPASEHQGLQKPDPRHAMRGVSGQVDDQDPPGRALLDSNDLLVVMAEDLGDRRAAPAIAGAYALAEVTVSDPSLGQQAWAYVAAFRDPPAYARTRYMRYDTQRGRVQGPWYAFSVSDDHPASITDLRVGEQRVARQIKVKGEVTLDLPLPGSKIEFSEADIHGYTVGYIAGPVRIVKRNMAYVSLAGGLVRTRKLTCDHYYYPHHVEIPVCLSIRFPVKEVAMTFTTDYVDPPFHRLYMGEEQRAQQPVSGANSVSGHMHRLGREWIALDSHEATLISLMQPPEGLSQHADSRPCLCRGRLTSRPAALPGERTEAGFLLTVSSRCPKGDYVVYGTHLILARSYEPGDELAALNLRDDSLVTEVHTLAATR
jgi:hypothetical protein